MTWTKWLIVYASAAVLLMIGCATNEASDGGVSLKEMNAEPSSTEPQAMEGARSDLTGMFDEEIAQYADTVIASERPFIYTGGFANLPIVDAEDMPLAKSMAVASVGCTGGFVEAGKFNKQILAWLKARHQDTSAPESSSGDRY